MYRVLKSKGYNANVVVENTDTRANIIIGKPTMDIIHIIKEGGATPPEPQEEWHIEVNKDTAVTLSKLAMKMTKPIRDQRKPEIKKELNKHVDAMDVMLGLANYN